MMFPGTMFGNDGERHVRMSLLAPMDQIREAVRRMGAAIAGYQREAGRLKPAGARPDARVVAVTGGAGFVGLNLVSALAEEVHAVVALHHSPLDAVAESG